jgi:hypothetical protein
MYEPGYSYYDDEQATEGNPNGYGYRNGRWVGYTPAQMPLIQPVTPSIGPQPGPIITAPPEAPSLHKKTNSHSYGEFLACSVPQGIENLNGMAKPMLAAISGSLVGLRTGRPWMTIGGLAAFAGVTMGPALKTRAECNEQVGGVIPNPF